MPIVLPLCTSFLSLSFEKIEFSIAYCGLVVTIREFIPSIKNFVYLSQVFPYEELGIISSCSQIYLTILGIRGNVERPNFSIMFFEGTDACLLFHVPNLQKSVTVT